MVDFSGQTIDQYRIERLLGDGQMGAVYQAYNSRNEHPVAIKVMHSSFTSQESFRIQFLRDMRLIIRLDHPNLVHTYDAVESLDKLYMVMEYVGGGSLEEYIQRFRQEKKLPPINSVVIYMKQVADALHYVHDQNFVHGEVKPNNVLFRPLGAPPNTDFQMAVSDLGMKELAFKNLNSEVMPPEGVLPYMAPEVCMGQPPESVSDVYSAGIILFEMAVGQLPFNPKSLLDAIQMHSRMPVPLPTTLRPGLPIELQRIILRCLEKDMNKRYQTAGELSRALQKLQIELEHKYPTDVDLDRDIGHSTNVVFETVAAPDLQYTQPEITPEQAGLDRLVVAGPNYPTKAIAMDKPVMVIGRDSSADVSLDSPMISRYHARLERTADMKYRVTDLGSMNGTWLGSIRLQANRGTIWKPGELLRMGDFRLVIEPSNSLMLTTPGIRMSEPNIPVIDTQGQPVYHTIEQIPLEVDAELQPQRVTVAPGATQSVRVIIVNLGKLVNHYQVKVQNIPAEWVTVPDAALDLFQQGDSRNKGEMLIAFHPPRVSSSIAGLYSYDVLIKSNSQANTAIRVEQGQLQVEPFNGFTIDMQPVRLKNSGILKLTIANRGNTPQSYTVTARDREDALNIAISPTSVTLNPGESRELTLQVNARQRELLGSQARYPFEIIVTDDTADPTSQNQQGELLADPWLTRAIISIAIIVLMLCGALAFCGFNQLLVVQSQNAANAALTRTAVVVQTATAFARSDDDGDRLSFIEENRLGTDPNNADTDGDGLSDYDEVKVFGTDPLALDSDGDTLPDGVEINQTFTSPNNPDTDGDGVPDNIDAAPLALPTAIPTDPPTLAPPIIEEPPPSG